MDVIEMICQLLEQKIQLFQKYEACTDKMLSFQYDDFNNYITERGHLATEIDKIDVEIRQLCESDVDSEQLWQAATAACNYGDLPKELSPVYDVARGVYAVVGRLQEKNTQLLEAMQGERQELLEQIKKAQNVPKIHKYLSGLSSQGQSGNLLNQRDA